MTELLDVREIVVDVRPRAADLRARNRWWGPGALRARSSCLVAAGVSVVLACFAGAGAFAVVTLVGFWLVVRIWGAIGARLEAATFPATVARIDAHGLRLSGATEVAIPWVAASATAVRGDRLLVRRGGTRYVVPLADVRPEQRSWLEQVVATSRRSGSAPVPSLELEAPPDGPGAVVLRWTSAERDRFLLQRWAQRTMPEARRRTWGLCLTFPVAATAASAVANPARGPWATLSVFVVSTALTLLWFPPALAKGAARTTIDGPRAVRLDSVGVSSATPVARWHARWDAIVWGCQNEVVCLRAGSNAVAIPLPAIPDPPAFLAELARRAGPPRR
jgi:hypothetical protein